MSYLDIAKQLRDLIEGKFEEHMRAYHKEQSKEEDKDIRITQAEAIRFMKFLRSGNCPENQPPTCESCLFYFGKIRGWSCLLFQIRHELLGGEP